MRLHFMDAWGRALRIFTSRKSQDRTASGDDVQADAIVQLTSNYHTAAARDSVKVVVRTRNYNVHPLGGTVSLRELDLE